LKIDSVPSILGKVVDVIFIAPPLGGELIWFIPFEIKLLVDLPLTYV